jgi:tetratricopeptide (TPR) repeat protein
MRRLDPPAEHATDVLTRYDVLAARGGDAFLRGDYRVALASYDEALELAPELDDPIRLSQARLNRAMTLIKMGDAKEGEEGLREILMRAGDDRVAYHASYHLASSLRKQGRYERAMSYARRAMDRARKLGAEDLQAGVHNLMGNIHLSQTYLDEALVEYRRALAIRHRLPGDHRYSEGILEENIGYCLLLQKHYDEGIVHIERALVVAGEVGDRRTRAECLQDLCYGHLLMGRFDDAATRGAEALSEALGSGYDDVEENCHYLLGELGSRTNDLDLRDRHFARLQELHPELPFLKDFLCSVDVTSIITLKR